MSTRNDRDQVFDTTGRLVSEQTVVRDTTVEDNAASVDQALADALATLQTIIDAPNATVTTLAQAQQSIRDVQQACRQMARIQRRLIRRVRGTFDAAD